MSGNENQEIAKAHDLAHFDHVAQDGTVLRSIRVSDEEELRAFCQTMVKRRGMTERAAKEMFIRCRHEFAEGRKVWIDVEMGPMQTVRGAYN